MAAFTRLRSFSIPTKNSGFLFYRSFFPSKPVAQPTSKTFTPSGIKVKMYGLKGSYLKISDIEHFKH
jgi:hypothetical protein